MFRSSFDKVRIPVESLIKEEPIESDLGEVFCDVCGEGSFTSDADLEIHIRKVHKNLLIGIIKDGKTDICTACFRIFKHEEALVEHIRTEHLLTTTILTHIEHKIYICDDCERIFFNKDMLIAHNAHWHIPTRIEKRRTFIDCPRCPKKIRASNIWFHFLFHGILKSTICPICLKNVHRKKLILEHILKTHTPVYQCDVCRYATKNKLYFNSHIENHRKSVNYQMKDIKNVLDYFYPMKRTPLWSRRFINPFKGVVVPTKVCICVFCQAIYEQSDLTGMLIHLQRDHASLMDVPKIGYGCVCGESFNNKVLLRHHIFKLKGGHKEADTKLIQNDSAGPIMNDSNEVMTLEDMLASAANNDVCYEVEIDEVLSGPITVPNQVYIVPELNLESDAQMNSESNLIELNSVQNIVHLNSVQNLVQLDSESKLIQLKDLEQSNSGQNLVQLDSESNLIQLKDLEQSNSVQNLVQLDLEGNVVQMDPESKLMQLNSASELVQLNSVQNLVEVDSESNLIELKSESELVEMNSEYVELKSEGGVLPSLTPIEGVEEYS